MTRATATAKKPAKPAPKRRRRAAGEPKAGDVARDRILRAAEALFSRRGFHAVALREVADAAGVSVGNVLYHFATKEDLFGALMADLERVYLDPSQPIPRALAKLDFPRGLETIGEAARETVRRFAGYIRLIYVDVIEFEGKHLGRLYGGMRGRFEEIFAEKFARLGRQGRMGDVDPVVAVMLVTISYMYYFTVEHLFGVKEHYHLDDARVIKEFARVFRNGILKR